MLNPSCNTPLHQEPMFHIGFNVFIHFCFETSKAWATASCIVPRQREKIGCPRPLQFPLGLSFSSESTKMRSLPHKVIKRLFSVLINPWASCRLLRQLCGGVLAATTWPQEGAREQRGPNIPTPPPAPKSGVPVPPPSQKLGSFMVLGGSTETNMSPLLDSSLVNSCFLLSQVWVENKTINLKSSTGEPKHYLCL